MKTYILFSEGLLTSQLTYKVKPITEDWHLTCNNFKGTEQECIDEGERRKSLAAKRHEYKYNYCEPHYPNAPYGSIWDY
jgi:hypothetical protein